MLDADRMGTLGFEQTALSVPTPSPDSGSSPLLSPSTERSSDICCLLHNYRIFAATRKSGPETKVDKIKEFVKDAGKEEEDLSVPFSSLPIICVLLSRK